MRINIRFFCMMMLLLMFLSSAAFAATVSLPQNISPGFGSTQWYIYNNGGTSTGAPFTGSCSGGPGLVIVDANSASGAGDAFDNAYQIFVNGSIVNNSTVDLTGTTLTLGPVSMAVNVTVQYHFFTDKSLGRITVFLYNPTGSPVDVTVQVPVNFGSDGGTILRATSSGDLIVTTADRWIVTSDSGPSDPVNTTVMYGPGAAVTPTSYTTTVFDCANTNGLGATFDVSVPAGATRALMFFAGLGDITGAANTVAGAIAVAGALFDAAGLDPALLEGLSSQQQSEIVNWMETTYSISGTVKTLGGMPGTPIAGVTITGSGGCSGTITTDGNGNYTLPGIPDGSICTVTPSKAGYAFTPISRTVNINGANITGQDFAGRFTGTPTYSLSGRVTTGGNPLPNVTMNLRGCAIAATITDANGNYIFSGIPNNSVCTVTPFMTGYAFTPTSRTVTINGANVTGQDFAGAISIATYSISGTVRTRGGATPGVPVQNVTLTLSGAASGTTTTNSLGNYMFTGLSNGNYTVTPSQTGSTFTPVNRNVTINNANVTGQDFTRN